MKGKQISTKAAQTKALVTISSEYYVYWSDWYRFFKILLSKPVAEPVAETTAQKKLEMRSIVYILNTLKNRVQKNNVQTHNLKKGN